MTDTYRVAVERGLTDLGRFDEKTADAILEIAYLTVAIDQELRNEELEAFGWVHAALSGKPRVDAKAVRAQLDKYGSDLDREAILARLGVCAATLAKNTAAKHAAYRVATLMALSDLDAADSEFEFDLDLIAALGLEQSEADEIMAQVNEAITPEDIGD